MVKLSVLVATWDILHVKDTGDVGFCDMVNAIESSGIVVENDLRGLNGTQER